MNCRWLSINRSCIDIRVNTPINMYLWPFVLSNVLFLVQYLWQFGWYLSLFPLHSLYIVFGWWMCNAFYLPFADYIIMYQASVISMHFLSSVAFFSLSWQLDRETGPAFVKCLCSYNSHIIQQWYMNAVLFADTYLKNFTNNWKRIFDVSNVCLVGNNTNSQFMKSFNLKCCTHFFFFVLWWIFSQIYLHLA